MNCKNCGFPLTNENEKCPSCGTPNEMFNGAQAMSVQNTNPVEVPNTNPVEVPTGGPVVPEAPVVPVAPTPVIPEEPVQDVPVTPVTPVEPTIPAAPIQQMQNTESTYSAPQKSKKGKIIAIIIISVVALLVLIGVGIVVAFKYLPGVVSNNTETETETETTTPKKKDLVWTTIEEGDDNTTNVTYKKGIEDDFIVYDEATFEEITNSIVENVQFKDTFGNVIPFDDDMFRTVASLVFWGAEEYAKMDLTSEENFEYMWAYLASLSFEFYNDNFEPESVIYDGNTNDYYFYGPIDKNNIGNLVLSFGNDQVYDEAKCGDSIYWKYNFGKPTEFYLGLDKDNMTKYDVPNMQTFAGYMAGAIDKVIKE